MTPPARFEPRACNQHMAVESRYSGHCMLTLVGFDETVHGDSPL